MPEITDEMRSFEEHRCRHCGCAHLIACPRVISLEFRDNGEIRKVVFDPEFFDRYEDSSLITFPEDVYDGSQVPSREVEVYRPESRP